MSMIKGYLEQQEIDSGLVADVQAFRDTYEVDVQVRDRVLVPDVLFYGKDILEMSIAVLLQGDNLLLSGAKATGKNVLCETLAWIFGRPSYDISFHVNTDSASLIGTDTFIANEVQLRKGPVYQCAEFGGFGILDEVNMAKNDAVAVLHAALDHRRRIDVPGYSKIHLHPATRFIGTMNDGYAGTKELNEALVSRFMLISAIAAMRSGLSPIHAIHMGIVNKSFDVFEKEIIGDTVGTRVPSTWTRADIFEG